MVSAIPPPTRDEADGGSGVAAPGWRSGSDRLAVAAVIGAVLVGAALPDPVPLGAARLWALVAIVAGAAVTVARTRAVDLAIGPTVGLAAVAGGVVPSTLGWPTLAGLLTGAGAGLVAGALAGATIGRVGRQLGALATLALGGAVIAVLAAVDLTGGVVGFHAVGLPTSAGDRGDALLAGAVAAGVLWAARGAARSRTAAAAAVAAADPAVARSYGRAPALDAAVTGAFAGGLAGVGGALLAMVDGSVVPAAYGLELTATVVAAAALGGAGLLGPVLGVLLVWGPATIWPLSPLGGVPVLLTAGPLALVVLAVRGGRPFTATRGSAGPRASATTGSCPDRERSPARVPPLRLRATPTPSGPVDLTVAAGEVVAVAGPNGAGKSTLLARIGGQLPDAGTVELDGRPAPRGPRRRAQRGLARTWQRTTTVDARDLDHLVGPGGGDGPVVADGPHGITDPAGDELGRLVRRRPRVALLDEPTGHPTPQLVATLETLRAAGAAVVLVDHRPEVLAHVDRVVRLDPDAGGTSPVGDPDERSSDADTTARPDRPTQGPSW